MAGLPAAPSRGAGARRGAGAGGGGEPAAAEGEGGNLLQQTVLRKKEELAARLEALGDDGLEQALKPLPPAKPHAVAELVGAARAEFRPILVGGMQKPFPSATAEDLAAAARALADAGFEALAVRTDTWYTSTGKDDLVAVCRAMDVPVLVSTCGRCAGRSGGLTDGKKKEDNYVLHPLQIAEACQNGADGVLGCIASVLGKGAPLVSGYAASLGIYVPIEVVNLQETTEAVMAGVPNVSLNVDVGLTLKIPGMMGDIAESLILELPADTISMVGVDSQEALKAAYLAGADVILCKHEFISEAGAEEVVRAAKELFEKKNKTKPSDG